MKLSINQPAYLPWVGYFHRIWLSDLHVVLDHVQFEKNSMVNRNKVLAKSGEVMLTLPVMTKGKFGDLAIKTLKVDPNPKWKKKHFNTLSQCYGKAPFWPDLKPFFENLYLNKNHETLFEYTQEITLFFLDYLGIETPLVYSSEKSFAQKKDKLVLEICQHVQADDYLSGPFGRNYLNESDFKANGVSISYYDFNSPEYSQFNSGKFMKNLSVVDLVANIGPGSSEFIRNIS